MTEHDFYRKLKEDSASCVDLRIEKIPGSQMKAGLPDIVLITPNGNFMVELKHFTPVKCVCPTIHVGNLFTGLQRANLLRGWQINKSWFGIVGWEFGTSKYLRVLKPTQLNVPFTGAHLERKRGSKWSFHDLLRVIEELQQ